MLEPLLNEPVSPDQPFLIIGLLSFIEMSTVSPETAALILDYVDGIHAAQAARSSDAGYRRCYGIKAAALGRMDARDAVEKELDRLARS